MIFLTDNADIHLSSIVAENDVAGIRLAVNSGGCSGFTYDWQTINEKDLDYAQTSGGGDYIKDLDVGKLVIDSLSSMYVAGMVVDYKKDLFGQRLMIENPNVVSMCGCGESFQINIDGTDKVKETNTSL